MLGRAGLGRAALVWKGWCGTEIDRRVVLGTWVSDMSSQLSLLCSFLLQADSGCAQDLPAFFRQKAQT